jgi:hypothetical protein
MGVLIYHLKMQTFSSGYKTVRSRHAPPRAVFKEFFGRETRPKTKFI